MCRCTGQRLVPCADNCGRFLDVTNRKEVSGRNLVCKDCVLALHRRIRKGDEDHWILRMGEVD